jgi:hypothetical protein
MNWCLRAVIVALITARPQGQCGEWTPAHSNCSSYKWTGRPDRIAWLDLLLETPECWDYRYAPSLPVELVLCFQQGMTSKEKSAQVLR